MARLEIGPWKADETDSGCMSKLRWLDNDVSYTYLIGTTEKLCVGRLQHLADFGLASEGELVLKFVRKNVTKKWWW